MKRREISRLCASAAVAVVAGCTGTPSTDDGGDDETYVRNRDRDEVQLDADDFDIGGVSLKEPDDFSDRPYITGDLLNEGEAESGLVQVRATFYDADGEVVDEARDDLRDLEPGESSWFVIEFPRDLSRDDFEEYDLEVRVPS